MTPNKAVPTTVRALRCALALPGSDDLSFSAWDGPLEGLTGGPTHGHAAYIVRVSDLAPLRDLKAAFVDRGRKHSAKSLSALLLGHTRVPIIDGQFSISGQQFERSVRTLLQNAAKRNERNAYVIGVADRLFTEIRKKARPSAEPTQQGRTQRSARTHRISLAGDEGTFPASEYLRLIEPDEVPASLSEKLVGASPEMQFLRQMVVLASRQQEPVLILGDTGTGKEVAAWAIHDLDPVRRGYHFVAINCGAISPELFESELFGHEPGAFTGARTHGKPGLWTVAGRGTLFLDEVGDLPLSNQVKILRALETNKIRPVGSVKEEISVHCRVIAATNRDLFGMVQSGTFREDLFYRLRPFLIRAPRLRDHPQDISVLAEFFWSQVTPKRPPLSDAVLTALEGYRWPGNARELRTVLFGLAAMFPKVTPRVEHVRAVFQLQSTTRMDDETLGAADEARMHRVECLRHLRRADEVIRACKMVLRPFAAARTGDDEAARRVRTSLAHRLAELQVLSMQPLLFHSIATFDEVHRLAGGLGICQSLIAHDSAEAQRYWKKTLGAEVTSTLSTIMSEVERLLKKL
jgi:DNA-binding NtrC family response regulator